MFATVNHPLVYLVYDGPIVGSPGYRMLLKWIGEMDIDITRVRVYNIHSKPFDNYMSQVTLNRAVDLDQIKILSLCDEAKEYLDKSNIKDFFVLPDPESMGPELTDYRKMKLMTKACKEYVFKTQETVKAKDSGETPAEQSNQGQD